MDISARPPGDGAEVPEDIPAAAFTLARALLDEVRNPGAWCPIDPFNTP